MSTIRPVHSTAHLTTRIKALRQRMRGWDVAALLVTNPRDIRYLTNFAGDDSWALVPGRGPVHVISDFRFQEEIARTSPQVVMHIRSGAIVAALGETACGLQLDRIGVQAEHVSLALMDKLKTELGRQVVRGVKDELVEQRSIKDADELAAIGKALAIQEQAYRELLGVIRPGLRECELAAELEYRMRKLGADGPGFPTIVAVDASASLPHAVPGQRKVKAGSLILLDWGARWRGYCSDLTRVVGVGSLPRRMRPVYEIVLEAQAAAIAAIWPGVSLKAVDAAARDVITKAGYGEQFGHGTGHGIGLDIHEQPTLSPRSDGCLQTGQVVTVEPGIYLPGTGGVRIEDDVLVTLTGGRVLSHLPKALESAII